MGQINLEERWLGLTSAAQEFIKAGHKLLAEVKASPEVYVRAGVDPVVLIEDMEFSLQGAWEFDRNPDYHTHWLEIKGCTCPKADNRDIMVWGHCRVISGGCPWHGSTE